MTTQVTIDFGQLGGPVFVGRPRGEVARQKCQLPQLDAAGTGAHVVIPEATYTINSSFFLGMFGDSIRAAGSRDAFLRRYSFTVPARFWTVIDSSIERALFSHQPLIGNS
jgi:hypothetical protein